MKRYIAMVLMLAIFQGAQADDSKADVKVPTKIDTKGVETQIARKGSKQEERIRKDLNTLCDIFKDAVKLQKSREYMDRPQELLRHVEGRIQTSARTVSVKNAWENFKLVDPADKENFWVQNAEDLGVRNWRCPEINVYYKPAQ